MAAVLSSCVSGPHIPRLLRPKFDCSRRVALVEQPSVCSLRGTFSRGYHSPLFLWSSRSDRLITGYAVNSVCWLVVCLLLLDVPISPVPTHCHFFAPITFPSILCTAAVTQPGGVAYATRNSGGPTAPEQISSGYVPSYPSYTGEQYSRQPPPPTSPSELQGGDAYEQQKAQEQPSNIQERPPSPYEQENYQREHYTYPPASTEQGPFDNYEQAPAGVALDNETHSPAVPEAVRNDGAVYGQKETTQAEGGWPKIREEPVKAVKLEKHSWTSPLNYETTLAEWDFTMAAVPVQHHVVLVPAIAHRMGQFWHRSPLLTANFEVQFGFAISGDETLKAGQQPLRGKGFAFWYVYDAYDKPVPNAATGDTSLFGYHSRPRGLGVFFKMYDKQGNPRPSISAVYQENGENVLDAINDVPVPGGVFFRYRNLKEPVLVKVAAGPLGVVGELRTSSMASWLRCFDLKGVQLRPGGFLGFTASNAAGSTAPAEASTPPQSTGNADLIVLKFVKVWNFNLSAKGEENVDLEHALGPGVHLEDILKLHSAHKDQRELADALRQLARVIYKHIVEHTPREEAMQQRLTSLSEQLSRLESQVAQWHTELQAAIGKSGQVERAAADGSPASATDQSKHALHSVSSELYGIKNLLAKHSQLHRESIESLKKKVDAARVAGHSAALPELRELANRTRDIEASLAAKEQFSFLAMIGLIFLLLSLALFVWKRFRDMEKKHLL